MYRKDVNNVTLRWLPWLQAAILIHMDVIVQKALKIDFKSWNR